MHDQQSTVLNKISISTALCWAVLFVGSIISGSATAEVYKWIDKNGKIHFTDNPPEQASVKKLELRINSFSDPNVSPFKFDSSLISRRKMTPDVIMYGASWCGYCKKAKKYFNKNQIRYVEYDIETSEKGKKDYKKLNGTGVPIILVGEQRMNGFSEAGFEQMYKR